MKKQNIVEIYKKGDDFGLKIAAGTSGTDVELALATTILQVAERQRQFDPDFKTDTLIEKIRGWIRCVKPEQ